MHRCFANPEAMRFWNHPVHTKRIETERAVRRFIDCTPSYYRFWAVADAKTDRCFGMVNYHDGHIRNKRGAIGYVIDPALHQKGIATEAVSAMLDFCFGELHLHRVQDLYPAGQHCVTETGRKTWVPQRRPTARQSPRGRGLARRNALRAARNGLAQLI